MNIFSILAFPASHSLSPALHNAVFEKIDPNTLYSRSEIPPQELEFFLKNTTHKGFSVSIPHKESIIPLIDQYDDSVKKIGACNTVIKKNEQWHGTNTDWKGFLTSLKKNFDPQEKTVLVLGSGGASRAIIYALLQAKVSKIFIWNRSPEKIDPLIQHFQDPRIQKVEAISLVKNEVSLVVNTTSLGMTGENQSLSPVPKDFWAAHHTAYDIVYTPRRTLFLIECEHAGGTSLSGENMLLYQAVEQSHIFLNELGNTIQPQHTKTIVEEMKKALYVSERNTSKWHQKKLSLEEKKDILGSIIKYKKKELFLSREYLDPRFLRIKKGFTFREALKKQKNTPHVIAEIKPASPSKGQLFTNNDSVESIASLYETNGVSAISVLTDFSFFGATPQNIITANLKTTKPLLRKDFIINTSQIAEAAAIGASAVLLMRSVLTADRIETLIQYANTFEIDCLVEVHDSEELKDVLDNTSANIIGINNRNLKTLSIDPSTFERLFHQYKDHPRSKEIIWVCESGISSVSERNKYAKNADAVLVGTGILQNPNREKILLELTS